LWPHIAAAAPRANGDWHVVQEHLLLVVKTPAFHLQVRMIFLMVSALAITWVFLQPIVSGRSAWEGLVAASILGLSWEVAYHARWIAPDVILMQFGALTLLMVTGMVRHPSNRYYRWGAAIAAGLACGSKYPGGLLLIMVLLVDCLAQERGRILVRIGRACAGVLPLFILSYIISTPGTLLDPINFFKSVNYELGHYQSGRYDQLVTPGLPHAQLILIYFTRVLFSSNQLIAAFIAVMAAMGIALFYRQDRVEMWLLLLFPVLYVAYFSMQRVMAVRNLLVIAPFLAILAARSITYLAKRRANLIIRLGWVSLVMALLLVNGIWIEYSARSIQKRGTTAYVQDFLQYVSENPGQIFSVSDKVWESLQGTTGKLPANITRLPAPVKSKLVFYASEGMENPLDWPSNRPGLAERIFGPWEVNFDYYPLWAGDDRILVMPLDRARQIGIRIVN
jgi:4-amino-4-deoxy-L-arabinose transferase-like glycosyltransferase